MTVARNLLVAHLVVLSLLLGSILYALRHPELWADHALGRRAFDFGMEYGAPLAAALAAATILAFGLVTAGAHHTERVFVLAVSGSLALELIGTSDLPLIGTYTYTDFLGGKLFDRVPYTVPLSAFAMGVSAYLLARAFVARSGWPHSSLFTSGLAAWLLTSWILAFGPPTAGSDLTVQFWEWQHRVPYFGLAVQNWLLWLIGSWAMIAVTHHAWGLALEHHEPPLAIPFTLYAANLTFAIALSASIELVLPVLFGVLSLVPAVVAMVQELNRPSGKPGREAFRPAHAR